MKFYVKTIIEIVWGAVEPMCVDLSFSKTVVNMWAMGDQLNIIQPFLCKFCV